MLKMQLEQKTVVQYHMSRILWYHAKTDEVLLLTYLLSEFKIQLRWIWAIFATEKEREKNLWTLNITEEAGKCEYDS